MSAVAFIRRMLESGFSYEDALRAAEAFEQTVAEMLPSEPVRSRRQDRNRRYYERRKASETSEKRLNASETSETSEPVQKVSPTPPSKKAPLSPPKGGHFPPQTDELAERLWSMANPLSRQRSGKPATRRAVGAALKRGAPPLALEASVAAHMRQAGDRPKGLHRVIEAELWRDFLPSLEPPAPADPAFRAECERHFAKTGEWRPEWGDRPRKAA